MSNKKNETTATTEMKNPALKNDHLQASEENFWKFVSSIQCNGSLPLIKQNEKKSRFERQ